MQSRLNLVLAPSGTLLALEIGDSTLSPQLRAAIALAVDRTALSQVIFQKQGEVTASLLPASVSGYSFLFAVDRDLPHAQALSGGISPPLLTLTFEGAGPMQLAAERLALNLRDAGFPVKVAPAAPNGHLQKSGLMLRSLMLPAGSASAALDGLLRQLGQPAPTMDGPAAAYRSEKEFLDQHTLVPLLYLPRAWAAGPRVRDLSLGFDGQPDLANASLATLPEAP
jgi:hypothetical protein